MNSIQTRRALLTGATALAFASPALAKVPAPKIGYIRDIPLAPYDEKADAVAAVNAAAARAKKAGKLLLIDMGGNWCPDCRILAGIMKLPEVKAFMAKHYETVMVDVGRMDKNLSIPGKYGFPKVRAVPAVIVVDPKGKVLNTNDVFVLSSARAMSNQAVVDQLAAWVPA